MEAIILGAMERRREERYALEAFDVRALGADFVAFSGHKMCGPTGIGTTFGDEWLSVGAAKLFSDGSLGAHTAWLAEPYADKPQTRGIRIYDPEDLKRKAADAHPAAGSSCSPTIRRPAKTSTSTSTSCGTRPRTPWRCPSMPCSPWPKAA